MKLRTVVTSVASVAALGLLAGSISMAAGKEAASAGTAPAPSKPTPTGEHKRLGYFVGKWSTTGDMKENPFGPAGKFTDQSTCEWFDGGFAVVCRGAGKGPMGNMKSLAILGYNTDEQVYTYYGVDSSPMDMTTVPKGKYAGGTWTYDDVSTYQGQTIKSRYVIKEQSPTSYTFMWEMEGPQGWTTVAEGTSKKAAGAKAK